MLSAPATMPATSAVTFALALAPAGPGSLRCSATRAPSPARSANASTGTSSAHDTRFGSSKTAETPCKTSTYEMPP